MKKIYHCFSRKTHHLLKHALLLACVLLTAIQTFAQTGRIVKGTVTDESNAPLPGVVVTVKSTGKATTTNSNGAYSIGPVKPDDVLKFNFFGFVT